MADPHLPSSVPAAPPPSEAHAPERVAAFYDALAAKRPKWRDRNRAYYRDLEWFYRFHVPEGASVLEIGCGTGDLLAAFKPSRGVGIDLSPRMIEIARQRHPDLEFHVMDAAAVEVDGTFDTVILSGLVSELPDIAAVFARIRRLLHPGSRILIDTFNHLWEPVLRLGERVGLRMPHGPQNFLPLPVLEGMLAVTGYDVVKRGHRMLLPVRLPPVSTLFNHLLAKLPLLRRLCLVKFIVARPLGLPDRIPPRSCSVVVPCRNERENIAGAVERTPTMGEWTELIFVDGNSDDGTVEAIEERIAAHPERRIRLLHQGEGVGKGDAVRKGFAAAAGDVLMILDADLTVPPEDLPKFFDAIARDAGEFVNGTRLVYPMRKGAMRFLNLLGNKFFSALFSWLLEQPFTDTLCGTKALARADYDRIAAGRAFFGDFDPFGDFDLIFGASKRDLKIVEIPIRYRERTYGTTKIHRFRHGGLLLKMSGIAFRKLKWP